MKRLAFSLISAAGVILMASSGAYAAVPHLPVPEPSTMLLLGTGVAGLLVANLVRKHRK